MQILIKYVFIINLIQGYNKNDLFDKETRKKKSIFWKNEVLNKAKETLYNCNKRKKTKTKQKTRRGIRFSFQKKHS